MIQILELINKDYKEIKDKVIWSNTERPNVDVFSRIGLVPQLGECTFNEDLYLFDFEVQYYRARFLNNKVYDFVFGFSNEKSLECIDYLINKSGLTFHFFTRDFMMGFCEKHRNEDGSEPNWGDIEPEFDESWIFDINNIQEYVNLIFFNDEVKIHADVLLPFDMMIFNWGAGATIKYDIDKIEFLTEQN